MSCSTLFPKLKPGGLYVVEDWQTAYWDDWPDGQRYQRLDISVLDGHIPPRVPSHENGMAGFVKYLIDEIVARPVTDRSSPIGEPKRFEWMHLNDTFAILKKSPLSAG